MKGAIAALLAWLVLGSTASAAYFNNPLSDIDPSIFKIDELAHAGVKMNPDAAFIGEDGKRFTFREKLGKPLILALSYYKCDGSCSAVNAELRELLREVERVEIGHDYRVLTASFDRHDDLETMDAFSKLLDRSEAETKEWTLALFENPETIKEEVGRLGFKYFWSAQDQTFFHPNVYIFFSADGRVSRYLYALNIGAKDVELALLDARQGDFKPAETVKFIVSLCYSYNFKEGRYGINIPLFVGFGSLGLGAATFGSFLIFYRRKKQKEGEA